MDSCSTSTRLGSTSPSSSVICKEVFDETCQPSAEEINEYASLIGIDATKEHYLLYLAKEGLMQALPSDWKICYSEEKGAHYYYNTKTKQSQWDHPLDAVYRELVDQARQKQSISATPTVDNSDDASQLDSGIRSLQGNEYECDNTNNTNEMSSPTSNPNVSNTSAGLKLHIINGIQNGAANNSSNPNSTSTSTSGFSGGVSRFLESRGKNFGPIFQPIKNTRFEVAKTNPQIGLAMKFGNDAFSPKFNLIHKNETDQNVEKRGFPLSGTGAMFLKSRRLTEMGFNQATVNMMTTSGNANNSNSNSNIIIEGVVGTPPGVKGILRDSSLTDIRRRFEKDEHDNGTGAEDKKSVRFNLDDTKMRSSPEEDPSSSRRLTFSPEASVNSDDDDDAEDNNPWDDDDDDCCAAIGHLVSDGSYQRNLNPFLANDEKQVKIIPLPKEHTIQMLKAQSFSMDLPERERTKLAELARSQSVEVGANVSAVNYLDKLKDNSIVKPLYEDTDSESKGSSIRSFIINKSEQDSLPLTASSNNPFDLDELGRKHSRDVEQLEKKLQGTGGEKTGIRTLKVASKLVGFLKKDSDQSEAKNDENLPESLNQELEKEKQTLIKEEREHLEEQLQDEIDIIKREHEQKLKNIRHEYDLRLTSHQHQIDEAMELQMEEYRTQLEEDLDVKRKTVVDEHKIQMTTLQKNHMEILQDLERDLKSEEELIKKEHVTKLNEMRDKMAHELEMEKQRLRDTGEDRLYEKIRCEKRLLEDKYRCLKEKYVRLKTDVKLSLERRTRRREAQALQQQSLHTTTTGSETERSISNKPSIGNSENRSISLSTSCQNQSGLSVGVSSTQAVNGKMSVKPPVPPKTHLTGNTRDSARDKSAEKIQQSIRKPGITSKYIKNLQVQDDTTSISQSDTTISNNYAKGRYLPAPLVSDNGNSDSEAFQFNQENNNNSRGNIQRKKLFSRMKSASTSRLNSDNYKIERPCTPVENLRHQLQKLEDLEDQFPENTLDATYHLRYPFSDISNEHAGSSSELEFFKHRIHLERDSVRRAKESLRTQRTNFRARQREIKQRHKVTITRHTLDQLIQEEKELTEMEVNLHRTRALLGEKVIRLRHLEQSLLRIYEKEKPSMDMLGVEQKEDATLSDLSSHSSSGFSSTDFASGADTQNLNKRKEAYHHESSECIQNLEILNAEIREILDILGKNQQQHASAGMSVPLISPSELNWSHMLNSSTVVTSNVAHNLHNQQMTGTSGLHMHAPQSIPTLADRLETYRQLASGRMQSSMGGAILAANTIVSQSPRAVNYTTSLVERTRDLRNWLRQAKNENELLSAMPISTQHTLNTLTSAGPNITPTGGNTGTQTNL
ncbi:kinesin-related protein 4 [Teleopsis dalmanni]|uniref:kinesin-related protein 4 n=1 Tax=Teleopsis dalmanni TaxID=139649 RepID=UPI0018CEE3F3|nr:kinesin-related protein 4 [Teleopsis dalmanni]